MRIDSAGNVGIGTSSPAVKLDVSGSVRALTTFKSKNSASNISYIQFEENTTLSAYSYIASDGRASGYISYYTNDTERMRILANGNVGIGTSSPSNAFVVSNAGTSGIEINPGLVGTSSPNINGFNRNTSAWTNIQYQASAQIFCYGGTTEGMRLDSGGSVLPGADAGQAFGSSSKRWASVNAVTFSEGGAAANFITTSGNTTLFNSGSTWSSAAFYTSGSEKMRILTGGSVCIGTSSAVYSSEKLAVSGAETGGGVGIAYFKNSSASGDPSSPIIITKTSTTTSSSARFVQFYADNFSQPMGGIVGNGAQNVQFLTLSDEREKTNIKPVDGALNRIMKLKVSSFNRKGSNEFVPAGFVAQNVIPVYPEYVVENAANDGEEQRYGITGGMSAGYIAELTAAIQELNAKVIELEAKLASK
jgi:hypothetical protein